MIYAGTGHRPDKLGFEWDGRGRVSDAIRKALDEVHRDSPPITGFISGMALGFDMILAEWALDKGYPVAAAVPFEGQEKRWPLKSQERYYRILTNPLVSKHVTNDRPDHPPATWMFRARNEWMVQHCNALIACWDGSKGGTAHCIEVAQRVKRPIVYLPIKRVSVPS